MASSHDIDLQCPITHELFEDPISVPCCGNSFSRDSLIRALNTQHSKRCPSCRAELNDYDPTIAPKNIRLNYLVERHHNNNLNIINNNLHEQDHDEKSISEPEWKATILPLRSHHMRTKVKIGRLSIINMNKNYQTKTLFIPVIDESGSMVGKPLEQARYSLHRINDMTYNSPHLITHIITYHDSATSFHIDTSKPIIYNTTQIDKRRNSGGTSFTSAFKMITQIIQTEASSNQNIENIVIIFLTDGEDSSVQKDKRDELVDILNTNIRAIWKKSFTIHTVGFGRSHDFDFLNKLRMIGTQEGAYRYANPVEDVDSLSAKIGSLLNVIATTESEIVTILYDPKLIIKGHNRSYWIDITNNIIEPNKPIFQIILNTNMNMFSSSLPIDVFLAEENDEKTLDNLTDEWNSVLIDDIASEIEILNNHPYQHLQKNIDMVLYIELLQRRARSLYAQLIVNTNNQIRLQTLIGLLENICKGITIDRLKLQDIKFEGKFATEKKVSQVQILPQSIIARPLLEPDVQIIKNKKYQWTSIRKPHAYNYCYNSLVNGNIVSTENMREKDKNGSTILSIAASSGNISLIKELISYPNISDIINEPNNDGLNPLDCAIIFGWWITTKLLIDAGAKCILNSELLLCTCIDKYYYNTANVYLDEEKINISQEMTDYIYDKYSDNKILSLLSKCNNIITFDVAIKRGLLSEIEKMINDNTMPKISWSEFYHIFANKPSFNHIKIIDLLLTKSKADVNEIFNINNEEVSCLIFIACEKGNKLLYDTLKKFSPNYLFQNNKGTSCLWIASCNNHIDIVLDLLTSNSGEILLNTCNVKGDSPLIPACQKGQDKIVTLLLDAGAKIMTYNKNRDHPILICCRTNQDRILDIILDRMTDLERKEILLLKADIDGFDPIHAATELDRVKCIEVLVKYNVDLETRTDAKNEILADATSVHIAAFYARLEALSTLVKCGADILAKTSVTEQTVMHIAFDKRHRNIITYLMNLPIAKILLQLPDNFGRLPIDYARTNGNEEIFEEFFADKLSPILERVLKSDEETLQKCIEIFNLEASRFNDLSNLSNIQLANGETFMTNAIFQNKRYLIEQLYLLDPLKSNNVDLYGIHPLFWQKLFNININNDNTYKNGYETDDENESKDFKENIDNMVKRITDVTKNNFQNKLLLKIDPLLILNNNDTELLPPLIKMHMSHDNNIIFGNDIQTIQKFSKESHSILGLFEKLKLTKYFPDSKNNKTFEHLLEKSKIHLIKLIATGKIDIMTPSQIITLYMYSSNKTILDEVNKAITKWDMQSIWNPFIYTLYQAIQYLPIYSGEIYKAINYSLDKSYDIDTIINWSTFSICSKKYADCTDMIKDNKGIIFIIHTKTGRSVGIFGKTPMDDEIIIVPGTKLKIISFIRADQIALGQANIRKSTYTARPIDIEKAMNGACIIIELEEVEEI